MDTVAILGGGKIGEALLTGLLRGERTAADIVGLQAGVLLHRAGPLPDTSLLLDGTPSARAGWAADLSDALPVGAPGDAFARLVKLHDLPPIGPIVTRIHRHRGRCPCCRQRVAAPAPQGFEPGSPFGPELCALIIHLHVTQAIGFQRLARLMAEAFGVHGIRCEKPDELDAAILEMINVEGPVIFDCRVAKLENCLPMIRAGRAHNDMLLPDDADATTFDSSADERNHAFL